MAQKETFLMKKLIIALIAMGILAAGSITCFIIIKSKDDKAQKEQSELLDEYMLFKFDSDTISTLTFSIPNGGEFTAEIDPSDNYHSWNFVDFDDFTVDSEYCRYVVTYLSELTALTDYGDASDQNKADYGLDDPTVITAKSGSADYKVYVGKSSPTGDYYYVMKEGSPKIYAVDYSIGDTLKARIDDLKTKALVPYETNEIVGLKIIRGGETVIDLSFDEEAYQWKFPAAYSKLQVDNTAVTAITNVISRTEAQLFLDSSPEKLTEYGFDDPYAELVITGSDGTQKKFLFAYNQEEEERGFVHVLFEDTKQAALYLKGDNSYVRNNPIDFVVEKISNTHINDAASFEITFNGKTDKFERDASDIFTLDGKKLSDYNKDAADAFANMYNSVQFLKYTDVNVNVSIEYSEPLLSSKCTLKDGSSTLVELVPYTDSTCAVFVDGSFTGGLIDNDSFIGKTAMSSLHAKLYDLLGR